MNTKIKNRRLGITATAISIVCMMYLPNASAALVYGSTAVNPGGPYGYVQSAAAVGTTSPSDTLIYDTIGVRVISFNGPGYYLVTEYWGGYVTEDPGYFIWTFVGPATPGTHWVYGEYKWVRIPILSIQHTDPDSSSVTVVPLPY